MHKSFLFLATVALISIIAVGHAQQIQQSAVPGLLIQTDAGQQIAYNDNPAFLNKYNLITRELGVVPYKRDTNGKNTGAIFNNIKTPDLYEKVLISGSDYYIPEFAAESVLRKEYLRTAIFPLIEKFNLNNKPLPGEIAKQVTPIENYQDTGIEVSEKTIRQRANQEKSARTFFDQKQTGYTVDASQLFVGRPVISYGLLTVDPARFRNTQKVLGKRTQSFYLNPAEPIVWDANEELVVNLSRAEAYDLTDLRSILFSNRETPLPIFSMRGEDSFEGNKYLLKGKLEYLENAENNCEGKHHMPCVKLGEGTAQYNACVIAYNTGRDFVKNGEYAWFSGPHGALTAAFDILSHTADETEIKKSTFLADAFLRDALITGMKCQVETHLEVLPKYPHFYDGIVKEKLDVNAYEPLPDGFFLGKGSNNQKPNPTTPSAKPEPARVPAPSPVEEAPTTPPTRQKTLDAYSSTHGGIDFCKVSNDVNARIACNIGFDDGVEKLEYRAEKRLVNKTNSKDIITSGLAYARDQNGIAQKDEFHFVISPWWVFWRDVAVPQLDLGLDATASPIYKSLFNAYLAGFEAGWIKQTPLVFP